MEDVVERQREFYRTGATRDVAFRIKSLKCLKQRVVEYEDRINQALWEDLHKSAYEGYLTEIAFVLQELTCHIRHLKKWTRPTRVTTPIHLFGSKSRIIHEPLGVVLIMAPWNYPFQLLMAPLIGALSAGNCAVLKPSPAVPHVCRVMKEIIEKTFDPAYVKMVEGGWEACQELLAERFDYIFFTGSPDTGKIVMKAAAEHLTPVTLELGGKSPCIVDEDADIDCAARRIAWGKCLNAGQTCVAPDYLLVHVAVKNELLERIGFYFQKFYGERPADSSDYPRMVRMEAVDRMERFMQKGRIVWGGEINREKRYVSPTLLDEVLPDDPVMQEEIFGPLLPVMEFRCLREAIEYVNAHEKPLALYYFGTSSRAENVIRETSSGGMCVNDTIMHIANLNLPFGGVGNSGMGKYHGFDSFQTFSNRRAILNSPTFWDIRFKYPPYRQINLLKKFV